MTPADMARLHGLCFGHPRPWSAEEFAAVLASPLCFEVAQPQGFLIGRVVAGEAELLTLAVDPAARRRGIGRALVRGFLEAAGARGARRAFLEVAQDNVAALALYRAAGFDAVGLRRGYYRQSDGPALDARVLAREIA